MKKKKLKKLLKYFNLSFEGNFKNGLSNPYLNDFKNPELIPKDLRKVKMI